MERFVRDQNKGRTHLNLYVTSDHLSVSYKNYPSFILCCHGIVSARKSIARLKERQQKLEQKVWSSHSSSSRVGSEKAFATCHQMVFAYKISYGCHNWICFFSETWLCPSLPEHHVCLCKRRCRGQFVTKTFTNQATPCNPLHVRWATMGRPT